MRKTAKKSMEKRQPRGVTTALVMDKLLLLSTQNGERVAPVRRTRLIEALPSLAETTVDDRLRHLVWEGRVLRLAQGVYEPFVPVRAASPKHGLVAPANPAGTVVHVHDREGRKVRIEWLGAD